MEKYFYIHNALNGNHTKLSTFHSLIDMTCCDINKSSSAQQCFVFINSIICYQDISMHMNRMWHHFINNQKTTKKQEGKYYCCYFFY